MELRNIRTFIQVAELGNFSKAAENLGYAQSTVTAQIQQLEEELEVQLFQRNGKNICISEAGRKFLEYAYRINKEAKAAVDYFVNETEPMGTLRVGIMESLCNSYYVKALIEYQKCNPKVQLKVNVCTTWEAMDLLEAGELDVILTLDKRIVREDWVTKLEVTEAISFFCSIDHSFADRKEIELDELLAEPFILVEENCNYREAFEQFLAQMGKTVQWKLEIGHTAVIIDAVKAGIGVSLLPSFNLVSGLKNKDIALFTVKGCQLSMEVQLIYDKKRWMPSSLRQLLMDFEAIE